jgi:hypothetical protein
MAVGGDMAKVESKFVEANLKYQTGLRHEWR